MILSHDEERHVRRRWYRRRIASLTAERHSYRFDNNTEGEQSALNYRASNQSWHPAMLPKDWVVP